MLTIVLRIVKALLMVYRTDGLPGFLNNVFNARGIDDAYEVIYENIWEETLNHSKNFGFLY